MRRVTQRLVRRRFVGARGEINLEILSHVDTHHAPVAHVVEGGLDGFSLRIEDGLLRSDDDSGFHCCAGLARKSCGEFAERYLATRVNSAARELRCILSLSGSMGHSALPCS